MLSKSDHNPAMWLAAVFVFGFLLAVSPSGLLAAPREATHAAAASPATAPLAAIRKALEDGLYPKAEEMARGLLAEEEKARRPESKDSAQATTLLVEALWKGGKEGDPETRRLADRSVELARRAFGEDSAQFASSLSELANVLVRTDDFAGARDLYRRALALREKIFGPRSQEVALMLSSLAAAEGQMGNFPATKALMERAYSICEERDLWNAKTVSILNNLGTMNDYLGDYETSQLYYRRFLEVCRRILPPEHPLISKAMYALAMVEAQLGNFAEARPLYEESLRLQEKTLGPDHPDFAWTLTNLGTLLVRTGHYSEARPLLERAVAVMERAVGPNHSHVDETRLTLAWLLQKVGDFESADGLLKIVCVNDERNLGAEHPELGRSLTALGDVKVQLDRLEEAEKLYIRGLGILEKTYGAGHIDTARGLAGLGQIRLLQGRFADSESFYVKALSIQRSTLGEIHPEVAESLIHLARAHWAAGSPGKAFEEAIDAETILLAHFGHSMRLSEREALEYEQARASGMNVALSILASTPSDRLPPTAVTETWTALSRSRALVLDQMASLHRAPAGSEDPVLGEITRGLGQASRRLADLMVRGPNPEHPEPHAADLQQATKQKETLERQLAEKSPSFGQMLQRGKATWNDIRAAMPPGSALVAFALYERLDQKPVATGKAGGGPQAQGYLAFLQAPAAQPRVLDIGGQAEIDALVEDWRRKVSSTPPPLPAGAAAAERELRAAGSRLSAKLWEPVAKHLGEARQVLIVPDGALNLLSFATLPAGKDRYLVEAGPSLHYLSAERDVLSQAHSEHGRGAGALVIGSPDFNADPAARFAPSRASMQETDKVPSSPSQGGVVTYRSPPPSCSSFRTIRFDPLPGAAREVTKVQEILVANRPATSSGGEVLEIVAADATEEAFKTLAPGRQVLHVATHGFFLEDRCSTSTSLEVRDNPLLLSGLVLAGANRRSETLPGEEDGILTSEEIATLDLSSVDLAVLSACETGLGRVQAGEGVLGLRRAFQIAGARTLVMSLWRVADNATQEWMKNLYEARRKGMSTSEAARNASVAMIRDRRSRGTSTHPFFWGGFVATGDWR